MNARDVQSGWLHQESLDGIEELSVTCDQIDLIFEADDTLEGIIQLIVEPVQDAPVLRRSGRVLDLEQKGRYRGKVTPLIRVPAGECPRVGVKLGKGDLTFSEINAPLAIKLGMGDVNVRGGTGAMAASIGKGDISIARRDEAIAVKLGMGDVSIAGCQQGIVVALGRGDISLSDCGSEVELKTGNGDISIANPQEGEVFASTSSGDISIAGGDVYRVMARTGKGDIHSTTRLLARAEDLQPEPEDTEDIGGILSLFRDEEGASVEDIVLNLSDLQFEAGDQGVRIARGDRDILRLGPDGIQISGKGREISLGPDGIRVGGTGMVPSGSEQFSFDTGRGDIRVDLASDLPARVEVLATGDVQSDVPLVSVGRPGPRGTVKRQVGVTDGGDRSGRVNIRLRTGRGDVALRTVRVPPRPQPTPDAGAAETDRDERARVILEALARGDLSVGEAERLLAALDQ